MTQETQSYECVAHEYYDPSKHPTCFNLREASLIAIKRALGKLTHKSQVVLEVGAGKSVFLEDEIRNFHAPRELLLLDKSDRMLAYSKELGNASAKFLHADVTGIPLPRCSVDLIVSSLGDPYNCLPAWLEFGRVLRPEGKVIFTTPAYQWASLFRSQVAAERENAAYFISNGHEIYLPSFILEDSLQIKLMQEAGFSTVYHEAVKASALSGPLSSKLTFNQGDLDVVTCFGGEKSFL